MKTLAGCRTLDLCQVSTADLGADTLTLTVEASKTREPRTVPLAADVAADLWRVAGQTWLWEQSLEESKRFRPNPRMKSRVADDLGTWRWTIQNLFREFNRANPGNLWLRPHDL
ncbi:site-specific integrase [Urbifossiella limnaea]|uniref:Uncharacterized protein n=1 Tax=Urbifossiella limnaea TaxID=2528023 RepID=A0A517XQB1_9BACT|nr:site-specific integrase [Urbifossiella limnaea]QDU19682.1 hypothetical protein ETAA1_16120 [Urbifossiella limnaea]